jgi:hypothetical protein
MPSRMRICVKPISRTNSSFVCSLRDGIVFVTLNILLMQEVTRATRGRMLCLPKVFEYLKRLVNLLFLASLDHGLNLDWMRTVDHTEDVVTTDEAKSG